MHLSAFRSIRCNLRRARHDTTRVTRVHLYIYVKHETCWRTHTIISCPFVTSVRYYPRQQIFQAKALAASSSKLKTSSIFCTVTWQSPKHRPWPSQRTPPSRTATRWNMRSNPSSIPPAGSSGSLAGFLLSRRSISTPLEGNSSSAARSKTYWLVIRCLWRRTLVTQSWTIQLVAISTNELLY